MCTILLGGHLSLLKDGKAMTLFKQKAEFLPFLYHRVKQQKVRKDTVSIKKIQQEREMRNLAYLPWPRNKATSYRPTQLENSTLPDGNAGGDVSQTVAA